MSELLSTFNELVRHLGVQDELTFVPTDLSVIALVVTHLQPHAVEIRNDRINPQIVPENFRKFLQPDDHKSRMLVKKLLDLCNC